MSDKNNERLPVDFEDDGFFEPTIEEAIMASGLHKQHTPE